MRKTLLAICMTAIVCMAACNNGESNSNPQGVVTGTEPEYSQPTDTRTAVPSAIPVIATEGTCGDDLRWGIDNSQRLLIISGSGGMWNYVDPLRNDDTRTSAPPPWYEAGTFDSIQIEEGVTRIGEFAFSGLIITHITLPNSLLSFGASSFAACDIQELLIPEGVTSVEHHAFYGSTLEAVYLPSTLLHVGEYAFICPKLTEVYFYGLPPIFDESEDGSPLYRYPHEAESVFPSEYNPPTVYYKSEYAAQWQNAGIDTAITLLPME